MPYRDHEPIKLEEFNGLWAQGDDDKCPNDHFQDCNNLVPIGDSSVTIRDGVGPHQDVVAPIGNIAREYNYITQDKNTLLTLTWDGTTGKIYHVVDSITIFGPILTIDGMSDFGFVPFAGRAYITPFGSFPQGESPSIEKGLENEFLYVYKGDGFNARKAAGTGTPTGGTLTISNGAAGNTDPGFHLFAVVGETDTGFLSAPTYITSFTTSASLSVDFNDIPAFTGAWWVKRHIVATKVIPSYNGNTEGYQFFFIPNADLNDNTTTSLTNISFFDADLLDDASHLFDNYQEIPAGVGLTLYHNRLALFTTFTDISLALVSQIGEPEAINQLTGLLIVPLDGNPITNAQELRDIFYMMKRNRTVAYVDNGDEPSTWQMTVIDQAIGCPVHGVATVIDSGGTNVNYLILASYSGVVIFNGNFVLPELSWKIFDFWLALDRNLFRNIQILNDSINKILYIVLPNQKMIIGDYKKGLDPKSIRWFPWQLPFSVNTIALVNIDQLIIGAGV